ncbi:MAG: hypothetical protein IJD91_03175 [Clostridia bacterium]|nr:hypothetical protein [Clostridia bacterium]
MKERLKGIVIGIVIGALLVPTVFATVGTVTKELSYNNIKITLDGSEITPTDASGAYVEPFIMDGTTYLPVRGIANALDLGVEWDGGTNTVKLSSGKTSGTPSTGAVTKVGDVIYDLDGVKVTLTDIEEYYQTYKYKFLVENSSDKDVQFYASEISVNDLMLGSVRTMGSAPVKPGKKAEASLSIGTGEKSSPKIDKIRKIEMTAEYYHVVDGLSRKTDSQQTVVLNFE